VRGAAHGADEGAGEPAPGPEETRDLARIAAVADGHDVPVAESTIEVPRGAAGHLLALGPRIGAGGGHDGVGEPEPLPEIILQVEVQPGRDLDVDVHDPGPARTFEQALHLRPRQPELAGRLLLGSTVDVVAVGDPGEELELLRADVDRQWTPQGS
jgi:hypothetical protein